MRHSGRWGDACQQSATVNRLQSAPRRTVLVFEVECEMRRFDTLPGYFTGGVVVHLNNLRLVENQCRDSTLEWKWTLWNSWMLDYAMLCYSMLLSLSAEELVQESDQCRQVTQVEMESLLGITWLFKSNCNCSLIEYRLDQD